MMQNAAEFHLETGLRCPGCGQPLVLVRVTSHEQCATCGLVWETCCEGSICHEPPPEDGTR